MVWYTSNFQSILHTKICPAVIYISSNVYKHVTDLAVFCTFSRYLGHNSITVVEGVENFPELGELRACGIPTAASWREIVV